jgi:predicted nucleotidyltransferase
LRREELIEKLKLCSSVLEEELGGELLGLVLFGSWARGEAREDSDVDVFVLFKSLRGLEARSRVYSILAKCVGRPLTLIDMRASELFRDELELTPLLLNILVDGVVVYDKTSRLHELVVKAREFVEKAGLTRYRTPDGKYGWKRRDNKPLEVFKWPLN